MLKTLAPVDDMANGAIRVLGNACATRALASVARRGMPFTVTHPDAPLVDITVTTIKDGLEAEALPLHPCASRCAQELKRVWEFYREESVRCAATLSRLQDLYALRRHLLHKRIGGIPMLKGTPGPGDDEGRAMDGDSSLLDTEFQTSVVRADGQVGLDALKVCLR